MNRKISGNIPVVKVHELLRNDPIKQNEEIVKKIFKKVIELTGKGWKLEEAYNYLTITLPPKEARITTGIAEGLGLKIELYKDRIMEDGTELFSIPDYIENDEGLWWS